MNTIGIKVIFLTPKSLNFPFCPSNSYFYPPFYPNIIFLTTESLKLNSENFLKQK